MQKRSYLCLNEHSVKRPCSSLKNELSRVLNKAYLWKRSFVNLVFAISSQFAGAVATAEFLLYFDYCCRPDYGDDYLNTHEHIIANHLTGIDVAAVLPAGVDAALYAQRAVVTRRLKPVPGTAA